MFLRQFNYKKFGTLAFSFKSFLQNFYFIYLFRTAFYVLLSEQSKVRCSIMAVSITSLDVEYCHQGDQIGRKFAIWAIYYGIGRIFF
jgi:hypothetical protein